MAASGQQIMESTLLSINPGVQHGDVNITEVTSDQEPDQTRMVDLECPNCKVILFSLCCELVADLMFFFCLYKMRYLHFFVRLLNVICSVESGDGEGLY